MGQDPINKAAILAHHIESLMDSGTRPAQTEATEPRLCVNAAGGIEWWFCYHYSNKITPGTEQLNEHGECRACGRASMWDRINEAPSFMLPDNEL